VRRRTLSASSASAIGLLALAVLLGGFTVLVAYGLATEYGDTAAPRAQVASRALHDWWFAFVVVGAVAAGAVILRRSGGMFLAALAVLGVVVAGTAVGAVLGVERKYDSYPSLPDCTSEFASGPAVPVTRAAQQGFESIDHPGPFSGGGSSGVDGCSSELMLRHGEDPVPAYRAALPAAGWRIVTDTDGHIRALKGRQAFELKRGEASGWTVWIGPQGRRTLEDSLDRAG